MTDLLHFVFLNREDMVVQCCSSPYLRAAFFCGGFWHPLQADCSFCGASFSITAMTGTPWADKAALHLLRWPVRRSLAISFLGFPCIPKSSWYSQFNPIYIIYYVLLYLMLFRFDTAKEWGCCLCGRCTDLRKVDAFSSLFQTSKWILIKICQDVVRRFAARVTLRLKCVWQVALLVLVRYLETQELHCSLCSLFQRVLGGLGIPLSAWQAFLICFWYSSSFCQGSPSAPWDWFGVDRGLRFWSVCVCVLWESLVVEQCWRRVLQRSVCGRQVSSVESGWGQVVVIVDEPVTFSRSSPTTPCWILRVYNAENGWKR